jgi:hypothetical protein
VNRLWRQLLEEHNQGGSKRKHSELSGMLEIKEKELQWRMAEAARIEQREARREMTDEKSRRNSLVMELIKQGKTPAEIES